MSVQGIQPIPAFQRFPFHLRPISKILRLLEEVFHGLGRRKWSMTLKQNETGNLKTYPQRLFECAEQILAIAYHIRCVAD